MERTRFPAIVKMATKAYHNLGDLSRDEPHYCVVSSEDEANYYGNWATGYGFFGVRFPKETTRDLTSEESKWLNENEGRFVIGSLSKAMSQKEPLR